MKNLITIASISLLVSLSAYSMECAKIGGKLYPVDAQAKEVVEKVLKQTTCRGKRFDALIALKKLEVKEVTATPAMLKAVNDRLNASRKAQVEDLAKQLSF